MELLATSDGVALPMSGGQSLMPMLNARLVLPDLVVDLNAIRELEGWSDEHGRVRFGALCRQRVLADDPAVARALPLLSAAAVHIGTPQTRNRGTVGGSIAHADPSAEIPAMAVLLDGTVHIAGPGGRRALPAVEFVLDAYSTALDPGELVVALDIPRPDPDAVWAFAEVPRGHGGAKVALAAAVIEAARGARPARARVVVSAIGSAPVLLHGVAGALVEAASSRAKDMPVEAVDSELRAIEISGDPLDGSAEHRLRLLRVVLLDVLGRALRAAGGRSDPRADGHLHA